MIVYIEDKEERHKAIRDICKVGWFAEMESPDWRTIRVSTDGTFRVHLTDEAWTRCLVGSKPVEAWVSEMVSLALFPDEVKQV